MDSFLTAPIDFEGQALVELLSTRILVSSAVISFGVGYLMQSVYILFGIFAVGVVIAFVVCVPAWSIYNRNPVVWLPPLQINSIHHNNE